MTKAEKARDEFLATINSWMGLDVTPQQAWARYKAGGRPDLAAALDKLLVALGDTVGADEQAALRQAVQGVVDEFERSQSPAVGWSYFDTIRRQGGFAPVLGPLDDATVAWPHRDALAEAERTATVARSELLEAESALEQAIDSLDVDAAGDLQARVDYHLPAALAKAQAEVARLKAERAQVYCTTAQARIDSTVTAMAQFEQQAADALAKHRECAALAEQQRVIRDHLTYRIASIQARSDAEQQTAAEAAAAVRDVERDRVRRLARAGAR